MTDGYAALRALRRPRLLIQAARHGLCEYRRDAHLRHILGLETGADGEPALAQLLALEADENDRRLRGDAGYRVSHHVDLIIALMAEARLRRPARPAPVS